MAPPRDARIGVAAILAGVLISGGQTVEVVLGTSSHLLDAVVTGLSGAGVVVLGVAFWGLRDVNGITRLGRIGVWLALGGVGLLWVFNVQVALALAETRHLPKNMTLLTLGFLLVIVGHLLFVRDLRTVLGRSWLLAIAAAAGAAAELVVDPEPFDDVGLFVFGAAWALLGVALLRGKRNCVRLGQDLGRAPDVSRLS
jgi:hypothetical protein